MPSFFTSYVRTALWSSTDDEGEPLDKRFSAANIDPETLVKMQDDCARFVKANRDDLAELDAGKAGYHFWLTRNGHGAGFWDGDYPDGVGERLTESAKSFGEFSLYVGDDGQIHGTGG